jgi:hypothetical protein
MINYVIYGHTDYLDVLNIQTDYSQNKGHLTLFINENNLELTDLYEKYNEVVFYDDKDTYATRVLSCLKKINYDYILLIHDIDIILKSDDRTIEKLFDFLRTNNFDRVDLKFSDKINQSTKLIKINNLVDISKWEQISINEIEKKNNIPYLIDQDDVTNYIYNVNPSIWKRESFIDLLSNFRHKNYRTIEELDVQEYSKKFKIFKMFSNKKLNCGYFQCLESFVYLHISHNGKLLPLNMNFVTVYGQSYGDISNEYIKIVENYNLINSNKWYK